MNKALSVINELPSNTGEIARFVTTIKDEILAGNDDPLKVLIQLKMVERTIEILLKDKELDNHFIDAANEYGKSFNHLDTHFDVRETGVKYDYSTTQDSVWKLLNAQKMDLDKKLKDRETFLKAIPDEGTVNPESGEIIYRPAKSSTTKVCVKL